MRLLAVITAGLLAAGCGSEFTTDGGAASSDGQGGMGTSGEGGAHDASPPPPIPQEGLLLWLRADAGVEETDGGVSTWKDQSTHQGDATQGAHDLQPKLVASALNGMPAVSFDGDDDYLELPPGFEDFSKGVTMFAVIESKGSNSCPGILEASNGPELDDLHIGRHDGELIYEVLTDFVRAGAFPAEVPSRVAVVHDPGGIVELSQSGGATAVESAELPVTVQRRFAYVGRTLYDGCPTWDGEIGELLVYDRALPSGAFDAIEAYLDARWRI